MQHLADSNECSPRTIARVLYTQFGARTYTLRLHAMKTSSIQIMALPASLSEVSLSLIVIGHHESVPRINHSNSRGTCGPHALPLPPRYEMVRHSSGYVRPHIGSPRNNTSHTTTTPINPRHRSTARWKPTYTSLLDSTTTSSHPCSHE